MTDHAGAVRLIEEMEQVLSDQVSNECPTCDGEGSWTDHPDKDRRRMIPVKHKPDCLIIRARIYLGKELA